MIDHSVVIRALPAPRLAYALRLGVGAEVHVGGVHPDEERLVGILLPLDKIHSSISDVVVDSHHPRLGQRAGVGTDLLADPAEARIDGRVVAVRSLAVHDAARAVLGANAGSFG